MKTKQKILLGLVIAIFSAIWIFSSFRLAVAVLFGFGVMLVISFIADRYTTKTN